jgi:lactoylglutathione lyase
MTGDRPAETKDYVMQQTMIRVKDPVASLNFYCNVLGFKLLMYSEFPQWGFNVYVRGKRTLLYGVVML